MAYHLSCPWYLEYLADLGGYEVNQNIGECISALAKVGAGKKIGDLIREKNIEYTAYPNKKALKKESRGSLKKY